MTNGVDKGWDQGMPKFEKQARYKSEDGKDLIDKWAEDHTRDEFRLIMRKQIEKYSDRYGKKDSCVSESRKMADYALRLHEYEVKWAAEDNEVVGNDADLSIASKIQSLTDNQLNVLKLISQGKMEKQIAFEINGSEATVKAHIIAVKRKLEVDSRCQLRIIYDKYLNEARSSIDRAIELETEQYKVAGDE